jgi:hypothetical protein
MAWQESELFLLYEFLLGQILNDHDAGALSTGEYFACLAVP